MTALTISSNHIATSSYVNDLLIRIAVSLQLTPTQYRDAVRHYEAVAKWLSAPDSLLARFAPGIFPQGSLRIGTTVRPLGRDEYDLDLVCELLAMFGFHDPLWVLDLVERRLRAHGTYGPMVERMNRCVRLNFAGQFHLDILPARPDGDLGDTFLLVPDRRLEDWKPSNPKGYAAWFDRQSAYCRVAMTKAVEPLPPPEGAEDKTPLQLAVQLFKRWRDVWYDDPDLAPISIVLTTLAGTHYLGEEHPLEALTGIVRRIDDAILALPPSQRLVVCNPAHPDEDLSERWDRSPAVYRAFVSGIRDLRAKLAGASALEGLPRLREFLEDLFGEDVATRALRDQARTIEGARAGAASRSSARRVASRRWQPAAAHWFGVTRSMTRHARYHPPTRIPVAAQIAQMRVAHPSLMLAAWHCGEARWVGTLRPSDASITYAVAIAYRLSKRPRVFVTAPSLVRRPEAEIPHRHQDGSLCLHLPDEWDATMSIAETIVPWATLWLYHYEVWHATGEWLGGGAHPRVRPRLARRAAEAARRREISTAGAA